MYPTNLSPYQCGNEAQRQTVTCPVPSGEIIKDLDSTQVSQHLVLDPSHASLCWVKLLNSRRGDLARA